jgi:hypothetical protein
MCLRRNVTGLGFISTLTFGIAIILATGGCCVLIATRIVPLLKGSPVLLDLPREGVPALPGIGRFPESVSSPNILYAAAT